MRRRHPWNFPNAMITRKAGRRWPPAARSWSSPPRKPAVGAGHCRAGRARWRAGWRVQRGLTGSAAAIGGELTASPIVRKFSFTGSTEIGRELIAQCAPTVKKVSMELGGNAPFIVFDDADLDAAVEGAMISKYRNAGQTCVCANRLYRRLACTTPSPTKIRRRRGPAEGRQRPEAGVTQGPMIDEKAVAKWKNTSPTPWPKGGKLVAGGKRHALGGSFLSRPSSPA